MYVYVCLCVCRYDYVYVGQSLYGSVVLPRVKNIYLSRTYEILKPQSPRIVRFLDRAIGCDFADVRPIGNGCYDLHLRSHIAIALTTGGRSSYDWWYVWPCEEVRLRPQHPAVVVAQSVAGPT